MLHLFSQCTVILPDRALYMALQYSNHISFNQTEHYVTGACKVHKRSVISIKPLVRRGTWTLHKHMYLFLDSQEPLDFIVYIVHSKTNLLSFFLISCEIKLDFNDVEN